MDTRHMVNQREVAGYYGLKCATHFGETVPPISVKLCHKTRKVFRFELCHFSDLEQFCFGSNCATKRDYAEKEIIDVLLTRYSCYLTAQNAESRMEEISCSKLFYCINP